MRCTRPIFPCARAGILGATLMVASGASCPSKTADCPYDDPQRCLWEQGEAKQDSDGADEGALISDTDSAIASQEEATELDQALADMIEIMGAGLEWALIDERARTLCKRFRQDESEDDEDGSEDDDEGQAASGPIEDPENPGAWSCPIFALDINGQPLDLEASVGVIALSAVPLDASQSSALVEFARARFDDRCVGEFEEIEGAKLETYHRCALPEGPYLVIARFPRDLESDQWQVSIAVVDAG